MKRIKEITLSAFVVTLVLPACWAADKPPVVPRFSIDYMDRAVSPGTNFYEFANGHWAKNNPVPADKSRWGSFIELAERNWYLIHEILEAASQESAGANTPRKQVGDFFASAMDTNRIEKLGFQPIAADLKRIDSLRSTQELFALLADFHRTGVGALFGAGVGPDEKNSSIYAYQLGQGGLTLPDRDYYLKESFAAVREKYRAHLTKMFALLGDKPAVAATNAALVLDLETALARASRAREELRDPDKNYNNSRPPNS